MPKVVLELEITSSGEAKITTVAGAVDQLGKTSTATTGGMVKLNEAGQAAQNVFQGLAQEGAGLLGRFGSLLLAIGPVGLGIGAAAYAAHSAITEFTALTTQVRDLAYISGGSARDVSVLVAGLDEFGVEAETVQTGVNKMSAAIESGSPALNRLGVSTRTTSGSLKDGLTMFYETVDALGKMTNEVERNALAREIFGRGWTSILSILREGSAAIKKMGEESGKSITEEDIRRTREYQLQLKGIEEVWESLKVSVGRGIVGTISFVVNPGPSKDEKARIGAAWGTIPLQKGGEQVYPPYDDPSLHSPGKDVIVSPETLTELEKRLKLQEQLASLNVATMTASAWSEENKLAASVAKVNAEKQKSINLIKLAYEGGILGTKESEKTLQDKADLEVGITKAANAEIDRLRYESSLKQAQLMDLDTKGLVAYAEESIALDWEVATDKAKVSEAEWAAVEKSRVDDIASQVAMADEEIALSDKTALYVAALQEKQANKAISVRNVTKDVFDGVATGISGSIRGVIEGTQTLEDAFKRTGENIALGLLDSIVKRGLNKVSEALLDMLPSITSGLGAAAGWVGSLLGFSEGGVVPGMDSRDTVPAMLRPGELVLKPDLAKSFIDLIDSVTSAPGTLTAADIAPFAGPSAEWGTAAAGGGTGGGMAVAGSASLGSYAGEAGAMASAMQQAGATAIAPAMSFAAPLAIAATLFGAWSNFQAGKREEQARGYAFEEMINATFRSYPALVPALQAGDTDAERAVADVWGPTMIARTMTGQLAWYGIGEAVSNAILGYAYPAKPAFLGYEEFAGSRASGGPVEAGKSYLIHPPEIFVPGQSGAIISQRDTRDLLQGGGNTYNFNIVIHAEGSLADPAALAEFVREKIKPELVTLDQLRHNWNN